MRLWPQSIRLLSADLFGDVDNFSNCGAKPVWSLAYIGTASRTMRSNGRMPRRGGFD
jgi:hypothetical protein